MKVQKIIPILFLGFFLFAELNTQSNTQGDDGETIKRCKREIVESYNLNGYFTPRPANMYICPAINLSCCSIYDQFMMFSTWKDKIKPKLVKYYDGIMTMYAALKDKITELKDNIDFKKLADTVQIPEKSQAKFFRHLSQIEKENGRQLIDDLINMHRTNSAYMLKLRSTFFCGICDFESHSFFQLKDKKVFIDESTCQEIAVNTMDYSYTLNYKFAVYLQNYSELLSVFPEPAENRPVKIKGFNRIKKQVFGCAKAVSSGKDFKRCKGYCGHYKFNANSPVIEGYQLFFSEIFNAMKSFLNAYGPKLENERFLSSKKPEKLHKFTKMITDSSHKSTKKSLSGRKLQEQQFDNFELKQVKSFKDVYDVNAVDPNFDEYVLNEMFNFQTDYDLQRQDGYVNFIKNKLNYYDTEYNYEDENDGSNIFKTNSCNIVDLENFRTETRAPGMNLSRHINNNLDETLLNLISHLKNKSKYKILYEKLDPALLELINDLENNDIKDFHRDNYLNFKDYSMALKKDEILDRLRNPR